MVKIVVLDCVSPDKLTAKYGPTGNHVIRWLSPALPEAELETVHIAGGAPAPKPADVDGIVISGSEKGVYDDTPWMAPLRASLEDYRAAGTPVFGICFGHQIMADVWGGKAEKADKGFITGAREFASAGGPVSAFVAHQDQVTEVPPEAQVVAGSDYCPVAALAYDFPAFSVQFHPEYNRGFTEDLIDMFGDQLMNDAQIAEAKSTLDAEVQSDLFGAQAAAFFRGHIPR